MIWFLIGGFASWPLAVVIGRRAMRHAGGVALAPNQRWIHDHPNTSPNRTTLKFFKRYSMATMFVCGFAFAKYMTPWSTMQNGWYTRPDLKPKAAMIKEG
jgi:hypothetical protein